MAIRSVVIRRRVDDLDAQVTILRELGAELVAPPVAPLVTPPVAIPNGRRLVARHPDGAVFEYVGRAAAVA